jgi:hypothetical protein
MRPADTSAPILKLQVWHLFLAGFGVVAAAGHVLGAVPLQAAFAGVLVIALVALIGVRRARATVRS